MKEKKEFEYYWNIINMNFKFVSIWQVVTVLRWHWFDGINKEGNDIMKMPSLNRIKESAKRLMKSAYDQELTVSSGGFIAIYHEGDMNLSFEIDSCNTSDSE